MVSTSALDLMEDAVLDFVMSTLNHGQVGEVCAVEALEVVFVYFISVFHYTGILVSLKFTIQLLAYLTILN